MYKAGARARVCVCVLFRPVKLESGIIPSGQLEYSTMNI